MQRAKRVGLYPWGSEIAAGAAEIAKQRLRVAIWTGTLASDTLQEVP